MAASAPKLPIGCSVESSHITTFKGRGGHVSVEARPGSIAVHGSLISSLLDVDALVISLREAAKIAGLE